MEDNDQLSASLEDYLETIYLIVRKKHAARAKDIADQLQVKASSVTAALRLLSEKSLVHYAPYDIITLTAEGERLARDVLKRHQALYHFLLDVLGVGEEEAETGACKLEHSISPLVLKRLISFVDFVQQCPRVGTQWVKEFNSFCQRGAMGENCIDCINDCLKKVTRKTGS
ncbi:MAG: metal-dependent transcriptional regulator [Deltaproteobacteria bacterium]|nr:metal-dependent transcriptional regulator [Deltaproteobacteria bacterium]